MSEHEGIRILDKSETRRRIRAAAELSKEETEELVSSVFEVQKRMEAAEDSLRTIEKRSTDAILAVLELVHGNYQAQFDEAKKLLEHYRTMLNSCDDA